MTKFLMHVVHPTLLLFFSCDGTADPTVPYNGSPTWTLAIDDVIDYWIGFNNCNTTPIITAIDDTDPSDGTNVDPLCMLEEIMA